MLRFRTILTARTLKMPGANCGRVFDSNLVFNSIFSHENSTEIELYPQYESDKNRLVSLLTRCVKYGESNSLLIVGPKGCGKTSLINSALRQCDIPDQSTACLVKLSGLLQADDNVALEEISRQLKLDNVVDGMVFGSFEEKLQFLLQSLKSGSKQSMPVVLVIDQFDLFTEHKNQTLLYNLFDISQSKQTPLCVVGETCRLDVIELLEKRVKSRFSHRFLHLFIKPTFATMTSLLTSYLKLPHGGGKSRKPHTEKWNSRIDELIKDPMIKDGLLLRFSITPDLRDVKNLAALIVGNWVERPADYVPERRDFISALNILDVDSRASMLQGISVLDLCLIIAMRQLNEQYGDEPFTFQMVYEHYKKFSQRKSSTKTYPKAIAMKAFEHLIDLEIIKSADNSGSVLKQYRPMRLLITSKEIDDAVQMYVGCPSDVKQWAFSEWVH